MDWSSREFWISEQEIEQLRKVVTGFAGMSVLLVGVAMIFLPGPAFIFIPAGLIILSTEFRWAKNILIKIKDRLPASIRSKI